MVLGLIIRVYAGDVPPHAWAFMTPLEPPSETHLENNGRSLEFHAHVMALVDATQLGRPLCARGLCHCSIVPWVYVSRCKRCVARATHFQSDVDDFGISPFFQGRKPMKSTLASAGRPFWHTMRFPHRVIAAGCTYSTPPRSAGPICQALLGNAGLPSNYLHQSCDQSDRRSSAALQCTHVFKRTARGVFLGTAVVSAVEGRPSLGLRTLRRRALSLAQTPNVPLV